jgi:hypothetical protein
LPRPSRHLVIHRNGGQRWRTLQRRGPAACRPRSGSAPRPRPQDRVPEVAQRIGLPCPRRPSLR